VDRIGLQGQSPVVAMGVIEKKEAGGGGTEPGWGGEGGGGLKG